MSRQPFNTRWAQGVETEDNLNTFKEPGGVRISQGWEGGQDKDAPPAGQENWWHNRVDSALQDLERQGAMTWHAKAIYGLGAPCYAADGYYYESLVTNNSNNSPLSSSGYWRQIGKSLYSSSSVGEYKDVAHNGPPDTGWLKCNGAILVRTSYLRLFEKIGTTYNTGGETSSQFRLPDWRGLFPRFLDDGRGIDTGRILSGTRQLDDIKTHRHNNGIAEEPPGSPTTATALVYGATTADMPGTATRGVANVSGSGEQTSYQGYTSYTGGTETRSTNLAAVRWIRYL